jgi:hypothetical protein
VAVPRTQLEKSLIGPAGEHHCLAQLLRRGILATAAPPGIADIDLLVLSPDGVTTSATIQVKTRTYAADRGWHMKAKHEEVVTDHLFYGFVDFTLPDMPVVHIIPSKRVAEVVRLAHAAWLVTPGKNNQQHQDHNMRRIMPNYSPLIVEGVPDGWMDEYRERWDLISGLA